MMIKWMLVGACAVLLAMGGTVLLTASKPPTDTVATSPVPAAALADLKSFEREPALLEAAAAFTERYSGYGAELAEHVPEPAPEPEPEPAPVETTPEPPSAPVAEPPSPWVMGQCMDIDTLEPVSAECEQMRRDFPAQWEQVRQSFLDMPTPSYPEDYGIGIAAMEQACADGHAQACTDLDNELRAETSGVDCAFGDMDACVASCTEFGDVLACERAGMDNPWLP
jgi:hypothetical protein